MKYIMLITVLLLFSGNAFGDSISDVRAARREQALDQYKKGRTEVIQIPVVIKTEVSPVVAKAEENPAATVSEENPAVNSKIISEVGPVNVKVVSKEEFEAETGPPQVNIVSKGEFGTDIIDSRNDKDVSGSQWGSFPEISVWTGGWLNPEGDTGGLWASMKYLQWFTKYEKPENFGVGLSVKADYGKVIKNGNADWGYIAPGPSVGYYRGLGLKNSVETDAALLYRIDKNRTDGLMPTFHLELSHRIDPKNRISFQVDASYFPGDSWIGPGFFWEHKFGKDLKLIAGVGGSLGFLDGSYIPGFVPSIRLKYKNRLNIGFSATLFTGAGPFYGVILAYELTPDINTWYETKKVKSVRLIKNGEITKGPDGSNPLEIKITEKTINEMEKEEGK
jgi:hypothetical protein